MELSPRYDGAPVLRVEGVGDPSVPLARQRRRFASILADLSDEQWRARSRCDAWTVQDVVSHLVTTNQFWAASLAAGATGSPTRYLQAFDPVATPAALVDAVRGTDPAATLAAFVDSSEALVAVAESFTPSTWSTLSEAPPGHIPSDAVVFHAMWDSWIHERDVVLPLGLEPVCEADEVAGALRYAAAIGPALAITTGVDRRGSLGVVAHSPDIAFVVDVDGAVVVRDGAVPDGSPRLVGEAVALVEGLTFRAPLEHDLNDEDRWLLGGLDAAFDVATG